MKHQHTLLKLGLLLVLTSLWTEPTQAEGIEPETAEKWTMPSHSAEALRGITADLTPFTPGTVVGQNELDFDEDIERIELIIIERNLDAPLLERFLAPNQQLIIDREEIERFQLNNIGDVLRQQPSVIFGGPFDENRDIRLRGLPNGFTQILIDGQRFPSDRNDRQVPLNSIPTNLIEQIEIIRTPTADLESQGIGGTVNLILRSPQERIGQITVGANALDSRGPYGDFEAIYGDRVDDISFLLNGAVRGRGSVKFKDRRDRDPQEVLTQSDIEDDIKDFLDYSFAPRLEWRASAQDTLHLEGLILGTQEDRETERNITQFNFRDDGSLRRERERVRFNDEESDILTWRVGTRWERQLSSNSDLEIGFTAQGLNNEATKDERTFTTDTNFNNNGVPRVGTTQESRNQEVRTITELDLIANARLNWQVRENHLLSFGVSGNFRDREADKVANDEPIPKDFFNIDETQFNIFVQDEWQIAPKHTLLIGLRLEQVETTATSADGNDRSQSDTQLNPSLSYRYQATPNTVFRGGVARTVARPGFGDLVPFTEQRRGDISQPDTTGNPDLRPQTSWGVDLGVEQVLANGAGLIAVNGFWRDIGNLIESEIFQEGDRFIQRPVNVGSGNTYGIELDVRSRLDFIGVEGLTLLGNFTWVNSNVDDPVTGETRPFKEQPNYLFNVGFDYTLPNNSLSLGLNYRYVPEINFTETSNNIVQERGIESEGTLDGYLTWRYSPTLALTLYSRNLLGIRSVRPRQIFQDGVLQSTQTDEQEADRVFGLNLTWKF